MCVRACVRACVCVRGHQTLLYELVSQRQSGTHTLVRITQQTCMSGQTERQTGGWMPGVRMFPPYPTDKSGQVDKCVCGGGGGGGGVRNLLRGFLDSAERQQSG